MRSLLPMLIATGILLSAGRSGAQSILVPSEADLKTLAAELKVEKTRLTALEKLISFGSMRMYVVGSIITSIGDDKKDQLIQQAADLAWTCTDFDTLRKSLFSSSETLQYFALWNMPGANGKDAQRWGALLPRVEELAAGKSEGIRGKAQECLKRYPGYEKFLAERAETETSLNNIMGLVYKGGIDPGFHGRVNRHVVRLLGHPEDGVRLAALLFIRFDPHRAPMWQIQFDKHVFKRVMDLLPSKNAKERAGALSALTVLRLHDPDAVRRAAIDLVRDESENVRRWLPSTLDNQLARKDVQEAFRVLLRDPSADVRYWTVVKLDPKHHVAELKELAKSKDKKVAERAAMRLEELKQERTVPHRMTIIEGDQARIVEFQLKQK